MQSKALEVLRELERHYLSNLERVRALIEAEGGSPSPSIEKNPAADQSQSTFSRLTKGNAIEAVFRERGDLHKKELFEILQRRGHPIASEKALNVTLSRDERFVSKGAGKWGLAHHTPNGDINRTGPTPYVPEIHHSQNLP